MQQLMGSGTLASTPYVPAIRDAVTTGTGVVQWSMICNPKDWYVTPKVMYIHPRHYLAALKILHGRGWHYKNTARWRYLVRRGARK